MVISFKDVYNLITHLTQETTAFNTDALTCLLRKLNDIVDDGLILVYKMSSKAFNTKI